ncbi:hypothetical protein F0562_000303 [Nyssa sinensis]|uniref:DUF4283 domain-containing protein n=1 Tax=Nyssa sinensis TaxID=561372 RepID=A0A5J5C080_9ASTE|nr:hypothetical protein F0562_000303 [Nyssa sinensis]
MEEAGAKSRKAFRRQGAELVVGQTSSGKSFKQVAALGEWPAGDLRVNKGTGRCEVEVDLESCSEKIEFLQRYLLGRIVDLNVVVPERMVVQRWVDRKWEVTARVKVFDMHGAHFLSELPSKAEALRVLQINWWFDGKPLHLDWWVFTECCYKANNMPTEVWVRFMGVPVFLWCKKVFEILGESCGGFLQLLEVTAGAREAQQGAQTEAWRFDCFVPSEKGEGLRSGRSKEGMVEVGESNTGSGKEQQRLFNLEDELIEGMMQAKIGQRVVEGGVMTADVLVENRDSSQDQGWTPPSSSEYNEPESAQASEDPSNVVSETSLLVIEAALQKFFPGEFSVAGTSGKAIEMQAKQPDWMIQTLHEIDEEPTHCQPLATLSPHQKHRGGNELMLSSSVGCGGDRGLGVLVGQGEHWADRKRIITAEASDWVWRYFKKVCKILGMSSRGFEGDIFELFSEIDRNRKRSRRVGNNRKGDQ